MTNEEAILERLTRIEEKLAGVDRVEQQLAAFNRPFENLSDLGRDLSLLMDPAVRKLTEEMVEVEIGFQLEDFFALIKRVLPSLKYLTWSLEQLENLVDWWSDMEPILKIGVPKLIDQMDLLEQAGLFRLLNKLTSLEMVQFLDQLSQVPMEVRLEEAKPVGPTGLLWKMRSEECRRGLGVMLELTRALGKLKLEPAPEAAPGG